MHFRNSNTQKSGRSGMAALGRLARDEDGAAYTLSYVMVVPFYALLMCLIVETALMLTAKLGTVYAGYAAARSATVWASATTWDKAQEKAKFAALKTMTPFSSGTQSLIDTIPDVDSIPGGAMYLPAYEKFAKDPVSLKYIGSKFGYASRHLTVEIEGPPAKSDTDITVKITYDFPFNVPGIGRLIGHWKPPGGYYYSIVSVVTLPNEGPRDDRKTIGIGYGTLE
jgi:hypothetical protein